MTVLRKERRPNCKEFMSHNFYPAYVKQLIAQEVFCSRMCSIGSFKMPTMYRHLGFEGLRHAPNDVQRPNHFAADGVHSLCCHVYACIRNEPSFCPQGQEAKGSDREDWLLVGAAPIRCVMDNPT
jgi:hypothetical protein